MNEREKELEKLLKEARLLLAKISFALSSQDRVNNENVKSIKQEFLDNYAWNFNTIDDEFNTQGDQFLIAAINTITEQVEDNRLEIVKLGGFKDEHDYSGECHGCGGEETWVEEECKKCPARADRDKYLSIEDPRRSSSEN